MKKIIFAAALSAGLLAFGDIGEFAKKVTFTIEYEGAGSLSGIPVLVKLAANSPVGFSYSDCATGGSDIRFTDADGELIPFEIDTWDTEGESIIWVKPTSLAKGSTFTMHYCGMPATENDSTVTWSAYTGVWHFGELKSDETDNSQGLYPNSTAVAGIDGHLASTYSTANEAGRFGKAFLVNNKATGPKDGNQAYGGVWVNDSGTDSPIDTGDKFVISGWFKHQNWGYYYDNIFSKGGRANKSFMVQMSSSKNVAQTFKVYGSGDTTTEKTFPSNMLDEWAYLTFAYDDASCSIYENGALVAAVTINKTVDNDKPLVFGNNPGIVAVKGDAAWIGWIDEIRYQKGVQSAEWVAAEYAAMKDDGFVTAGEVEEESSARPVLGSVTVEPGTTSAVVSGRIVSTGEGATACDVYLAIGLSADNLGPAKRIATGVTDAFSHKISDLLSNTTYCYELSVVNNATPPQSTVVKGAFTTEPISFFRRRVAFTIGYEADGADTLSGIPVLVKLAENSPVGFRYADCAADGSDIRFIDENGELIPFEIDTWDPTGESLIWVKPASIAKGTTFAMYYKGRADQTASPKDVWTGYSGVWHFGELKSDTTDNSKGLYPNSTSAEGIDGHLSVASLADEPGKIGKSFRPNGATSPNQGGFNDGGVWVQDSGDGSPLDLGDVFTISGWIKHQNWNYNYDKIVYKRSDSDNSKSDPAGAFVIEMQSQTADDRFAAKGSGDNRVRIDAADDAKNPTDPMKDWVYFTVVFNEKTHVLYMNGGAFCKTGNYLSPVTNNNAPLVFGNTISIATSETGTGANAWNGWIDEIRYAKGAKSAEWIAAEYAAMTDDGFVTAGEVEDINRPGLMIMIH